MERKYYTLKDVRIELLKIVNGENLPYWVICDLSNDLYYKIMKTN
jgi:hypothetical protein